jgi:hypothetical protein
MTQALVSPGCFDFCLLLLPPGNYCPICTRCYEDNDYESKMMQCAQCDHWVHAKCEGLSGEKITTELQVQPSGDPLPTTGL